MSVSTFSYPDQQGYVARARRVRPDEVNLRAVMSAGVPPTQQLLGRQDVLHAACAAAAEQAAVPSP